MGRVSVYVNPPIIKDGFSLLCLHARFKDVSDSKTVAGEAGLMIATVFYLYIFCL